jgi:hypothetical protein
MLRRVLTTVSCFLLATAPALVAQDATPGQSGFVPLDSMPPREQIPAAPLLLSSYAFFLVLMIFYLWTIWRRVAKVEKDMHDLERRQGAARR